MRQRQSSPLDSNGRRARTRLAPMVGGLCLLHSLTACQLASDKADLAIDIPDSYRVARGEPDAALPPLDWWRSFRSKELTVLIEQAQLTNLDLAAAAARVMQADAQARISGAPLLPTADVNGSAEHSRASTNGAGSDGGGSGSPERNHLSLTLNASYEIDFWGKNRAALMSAKQLALASRYDREVVALSTVAAVATAYFQILSAQDRLRIARENLAAADRILNLIKQRQGVGTASALDIAQQEILVAQQRASIPPLEIIVRQNIATLGVLMGQPPEYTVVRGGSLRALAVPRITPGLPSDLLLRRPDIREAEAQLASATANIANARAQLFPSISLTTDSGFQSAALKSLFAAGAWQYAVAANLAQPIFHGGALLGNLDVPKGKQDETLQNYRKAVINGFADVERALIAVQQQARRETLQAEVVRASRQAFDLSEARLREGTIDLVNLLITQQALFQALDTLAQVRLDRFTALLSLYQALGGGWPPLEGDKPRGAHT